jgi:hypothetical protein
MVLNQADRTAKRPVRRTTVRQWADLFDVNYMRHVCGALQVHATEAGIGVYPDDHIPLRKYLMAPLDAYMAELGSPALGGQYVEVEAAQKLFALAERFAEHFEDHYPFDAASASAWTDQLCRIWLEFIAIGAGPALAYLAPKAHASHVRAGEARHPPKVSASGAELTPELVANRVKASGGKLTKALRFDLRKEFKTSDSVLFRLRAKAAAENLLP